MVSDIVITATTAPPTHPKRGVQRAQRHLLLAVASLTLMSTVYFALGGNDRIFRLSMATAYAATAFLCVGLIIGPLNTLGKRPNPINQYLRRDVGIWAGLLGMLHVVFGLQVHMRGKMWLYFVPEKVQTIPLRFDAFGLSNYAGLVSTLLLLMLLAISNNMSLRGLGAVRWKRLQRSTYFAAGLAVSHGAIYQFIEGRQTGYVIILVLLTTAAITLQCAGRRRFKHLAAKI